MPVRSRHSSDNARPGVDRLRWSGTRTVPRYTDGQQRRDFHDPFGGTTRQGRFSFSSEARLRDDVPVERLNLRQSMLSQFEASRRRLDAVADAGPLSRACLQSAHFRYGVPCPRHRPRTDGAAGAVWDDAVRTGLSRGTTARGGGGANSSPCSGTATGSSPTAPGIRTTTTIRASRSISCPASTAPIPASSTT